MPSAIPFRFDERNLPEREEDIPFEDLEALHPIPTFELSLGNVVFVDCVPVVEPSKEEKLAAVLTKIFKPHGKITDIHMPKHTVDEKIKTKGYCFVTFETAQEAQAAIKHVDGHRMDKAHVLQVLPFGELENYTEVPEEFVAPTIEEYKEKEHLRSWLADPRARDQWVSLISDEVSVFWNQKSELPEVVHSRTNWTETYLQWSPLGTYLCTFHRQGVALWGGSSWSKIARFYHPGVILINFSPNERYLVTWSNEPIPANPSAPFSSIDEGHQLVVWDVKTNTLLRSFPSTEGKMVWPVFKWSPGEQYFARCIPDQAISIYEAPSMVMLDKKSIKVDGVRDFEWSPRLVSAKASTDSSDNLKETIAFWTPEIGNQPARVTLMSIPGREVIRTKNLFNVNECKLHWHPQGEYLCVKVDRHTKTKKSIFTNLETFHVTEKDIPVEVTELKDIAVAFAWEPFGERFCVISSTDPAPQPSASGTTSGTPRTTVSFYGPDKSKGKAGGFRLLKQLEKKSTNNVFWSPRGRHLVLATLRSQTTWDIEFWDMDFEPLNVAGEKKDQTTDPGAWIHLIATQEHYGVTDLEWDPTGRYVLTSASVWRQTMENGYALWDFKGHMLQKRNIEKFKQIIWRPRPKSRLSKEDQRKIRKNLKEYSRDFDREDLATMTESSAAVTAQRRRLMEEWAAWRATVDKQVAQMQLEEEQSGGISWAEEDESAGEEIVEEWVEEVIEETEELVEDE